TALWAADVGGAGSIQSVGDCKSFIAHKATQYIAMGLDGAINQIGLLKGMLQGIIGEKGVALIDMIAGNSDSSKMGAINQKPAGSADQMLQQQQAQLRAQADQEIKESVDKAIDELSTALGPLMHFLDCGCEAVGTAVAVKNLVNTIPGAADKCADLL